MSKITDKPLLEALFQAGIADNNTRRVVIDIQANHAPVVYIERYGDEKLIDVVQAVASVDIVRVDKDSDLPQWEADLLAKQRENQA